jgi:hypothetical protein
METYAITVARGVGREGTLQYRGTIVHSAPCWWNPDKRIPAAVYSGCSATRMAGSRSKDSTGMQQRHGVFLPKVSGFQGIFIHFGENLLDITSLRLWSQGCIVMSESDVLVIWNDILPKDGKNVTVSVRDV